MGGIFKYIIKVIMLTVNTNYFENLVDTYQYF